MRNSSKLSYYTIFFLSVTLFAAFLPRAASAEDFLEQDFNSRHGLPVNQINTLIQDKDDFLWIGSEFGLVRFNGYTFDSFFTGDGLSSPIIYDLATDKKGNLWIGTSNGMTLWDGRKFRKILSGSDFSMPVQGISVSPSGKVCFISDDVWGDVERFQLVTRPLPASVSGTTFSSICAVGDNSVILGTEGHGLFVFEGDQYHQMVIGGDKKISVYSMIWDKASGILWLGTNNGLFKMQRNKISRIESSMGFKGQKIVALAFTPEHRLLVATRGLGVYLLKGNSLSRLINYPRNSPLNDIYVDNLGNIWGAFEARGVVRYTKSFFRNIPIFGGIIEGIPMAIFEDSRGKVWVGTIQEGVYLFDSAEDIKPTRYLHAGPPGRNSVRCIVELPDHSMLFGTENGLVRFDNGGFHYYGRKDGLMHNFVRNIMLDSKGVAWIATDHGITLFKNGKLEPFAFNEKFSHKMIRQVIQGPKGNYWIATFGGLYMYNGRELIRYNKYGRGGGKSILENPLETIMFDSSGRLWMGGLEKLYYLDTKNLVWVFSVEDGFTGSTIFFLQEDDDKSVWVGTEKGVQLQRYGEMDFSLYSTHNGLVGNECNARSVLKDSRGNLWFGTIKGISIMTPHKRYSDKRCFHTYIERLLADSRLVDLSEPIELDYGIQEFIFHYYAICLLPEPYLKYTFKLEGYDSTWSAPTSQIAVKYPHLPPGFYTFKVKAYERGGTSNEDHVTSLSFSIIPPLWGRVWFKGVIFLLTFSLVSLGVMRFLRRVRREKNALQRAVKQRTRELEEKNQELESFAYTVSHDLKDPMGVIVGYVGVLENMLEQQGFKDKDNVLDGIKRNSRRIVDLIDNLLRLSRSGKVIENAVETDTAVIVRQIRREFMERHKLSKDFLVMRNLPVIMADLDSLYLVFQNLVKNAYKYRSRKRKAKITISYSDSEAGYHLFKVKDNGIGIDKNKLQQIFETGVRLEAVETEGYGLGLKIVRKIVEAHGGRIWVESEQGKGSTFFFTVKIVKPKTQKQTALHFGASNR